MSDDVARKAEAGQIDLIRRVDQVDSKVDMLNMKLDNMVEQFRLGMEAVVNRAEDRWTLVEQRLEMGTREQNQSIRLLTTLVEKTEQGNDALERQVAQIRQDVALSKGSQVETDKQVDAVQDTLKWISRAVAGMLLTMVGTVITALLIFILTH